MFSRGKVTPLKTVQDSVAVIEVQNHENNSQPNLVTSSIDEKAETPVSESQQMINKQDPSIRISIQKPINESSKKSVSKNINLKIKNKFRDIIKIFFGKQYQHQDVLVTTGLILLLIGLGSTFLGFYVFLDSQYPIATMLYLGPGMLLVGLIICILRIIAWEPCICACYRKRKAIAARKASRNSAFFTAASAAMAAATSVSIRYGQENNSDPFIPNYKRVITSPKSAANAVLFAHKLLKSVKERVGPQINKVPTFKDKKFISSVKNKNGLQKKSMPVVDIDMSSANQNQQSSVQISTAHHDLSSASSMNSSVPMAS